MDMKQTRFGILLIISILAMNGCGQRHSTVVDRPQSELDNDCGLEVYDETAPALITLSRSAITPANKNSINDLVEIRPTDSNAGPLLIEITGGPKCATLWRAEIDSSEAATWHGRDANNHLVESGIYYAGATGSGQVRSQNVPILVTDDPCVDGDQVDSTVVSSQLSLGGKIERVIEVERRGRLCVSASASSEASGRLQLSLNGNEVLPASMLIGAGGKQTLSFSVDAGAHQLGIKSGGQFNLNIDYVPTDFGAPTGPPVPAIRCMGILRGFKHPFGLHGHDPIIRAGVPVECVAHYKVDFGVIEPGPDGTPPYKPTRVIKNVLVRAQGLTGPAGEFDITITSSDFARSDVVASASEFQKLWMQCIGPDHCGHEANSIPRTVISNLSVTRQVEDLDIFDVLHLVRPTEDQLTAATADAPLLGARLITSGRGAGRNDRPVIIHEQIDTANVEQTKFMTWALSGQPTLVPENVDPDVCSYQSAEFDERPIACVNFTGKCNPDRCGENGVRCRTANILRQLLDNGYDVWAIDHISGESDVLRIAASAPALYNTIRMYGVKPGQQVVDPEIGTGPPLPVTPPGSTFGSRRIAVGGISLGAVVSRIGLKFWEQRNTLPKVGVTDLDSRQIVLPGVGPSSAFMAQYNDPLDDVALYFSFDGPHLGARIPLALQAYMQDIPASFDIEQTAELRADSTKGMLERYVSDAPDIGCILTKDNGDLDAENCTVSNLTLEVVENASEIWANRIQESTIANLDSPTDDPLGRPADGLPNWIPAVAISNGSDPDTPRNVGSDEVFRVKFDIDDATDREHKLREKGIVGFSGRVLDDGVQPAGSEWDGLCRADGIAASAIANTEGGWAFLTTLLGCFNSVGDGVVCIPNLIVNPFTGDSNPIKVSASVRMKPEYDDAGNRLPNTGFPTLVRTESALLDVTSDGEFNPSETWRDYYIPDRDRFHSDLADDQCKFLMYHLDGTMSGDGDGFPACDNVDATAACSRGGRWPGERFAAEDGSPVCDCNDSRADIYPGAPGYLDCNLRPSLNMPLLMDQ